MFSPGPPVPGYTEIMPRQYGEMSAAARNIESMFQQQEQTPTSDLLLQSMSRDEGTRLSLTDIVGRYIVDLYFTAKEAVTSWETRLLQVQESDTLYGEIRKSNVPAHILSPTPEGAPVPGVIWSYETLKFLLTRHGLEVRVRDGELQTTRGRKLFVDRIGELMRAFARTVKFHIHVTVHQAPLFAKRMVEEQGFRRVTSFREMAADRYKYFGILDTERHIYDAHAYKQEEGQAAGLGPEAYNNVVVPRSSYIKMRLNNHATEASRFGQGAVQNMEQASKFDQSFIPGLKVWSHVPEHIPTQSPEDIDLFTRDLYVGGWVVLDKNDPEGKVWFYNGAPDTHTAVSFEDVFPKLPEFDPRTGTFTRAYADFAQNYDGIRQELGFAPGGESSDPWIWKDAEGAFHVAETYGEVADKFRDYAADAEMGKEFAKQLSPEDAQDITKLMMWQDKLANPPRLDARDRDNIMAMAAAYQIMEVGREYTDYRTEFGVHQLPRWVQDTGGGGGAVGTWRLVLPDGRALLKDGTPQYARGNDTPYDPTGPEANSFAWSTAVESKERLPWGCSTLDFMFEIARRPPPGMNGDFLSGVRKGVAALEKLYKIILNNFPDSRLNHSQFWDGNDASARSELNRAKFSALAAALDLAPRARSFYDWGGGTAAGARPISHAPVDREGAPVAPPPLNAPDANWQAAADAYLLAEEFAFFNRATLTGAGNNVNANLGADRAGPRYELARMAKHPAINANALKMWKTRPADFRAAWADNFGADYAAFAPPVADDGNGLPDPNQKASFEHFLRQEVVNDARFTGSQEEKRSKKIAMLAFAMQKGMVALIARDRGRKRSVKLTAEAIKAQQKNRLPRELEIASQIDESMDERDPSAVGDRADRNFTRLDLSFAPDYYHSLAEAAPADVPRLQPADPMRPHVALANRASFGFAQAEFGLGPGEAEQNRPKIKMSVGLSLLLDVEGPFYTRDHKKVLKKNLVERLKKIYDRMIDPIARCGAIHALFSEVCANSALSAVRARLPNPMGSVLLFFPFAHFRMSAAIWFVDDPDTGRLLHTRLYFYQSLDTNTQDWSFKVFVWIGGAVQRMENINLQPDVSYRKYLGGLDHSIYSLEEWREDVDYSNESGYRCSIIPVCTGVRWGREEACSLGEISMLGSHAGEDPDVMLNAEDERRYRPKNNPYYPGALWLSHSFRLKNLRRAYGDDKPNTYAELRAREKVDFLCEKQQSFIWNEKRGKHTQVTQASKPFVNVKFGDGLYNLFNHQLPSTPVM